ncbi:fibronectin type III [Sparganum proliferum]
MLLFHIFCSAGLRGEQVDLSEEMTTESKYVDVNESKIPVFPHIECSAVGRSHDIVVTMKPPKNLVATFKAFVFRDEDSRRSCTLTSEGKMLSCGISRLQPNFSYAVGLEVCMQATVCSVYGNILSVRTRPSVPRYISVANRTNDTFDVFWTASLEDPNSQYVYKVRAVRDEEMHTCASVLSNDSSSSCTVSNLTRGTKYDVSVSACTTDNHCSDYTPPVLGETFPNPPRSTRLLKTSRTSLLTTFLPPEDDKESSFVYAGTFEAVNGVNFYKDGCETQKLVRSSCCSAVMLSPGTKYNFRTFACTHGSFLCSEGQSTIVETVAPKPNRINVVRLDNGSAYASWHSTLKRADHGHFDFRVTINERYNESLRLPVREGDYNLTINGLTTGHFYRFLLEVCNKTVCNRRSRQLLMAFLTDLKPNQPTDVTQTTAFVSWRALRGWSRYTRYGFVYATPVNAGWGQQQQQQQQCVGVNRNDCTLQNLRPNTEYSVVVKGCWNLGVCAPPTKPMQLRTAKANSLEAPLDIQVSNVRTTSFSLTWSRPVADIADSFEYKISLSTPNETGIPGRSFLCASNFVNGNVSCSVTKLYTDVSYSVTVMSCATVDVCSEPTMPILVKTAVKDGYSLNATVIAAHVFNVSWFCNETKPDTEFRVVVNSSSTAACTSSVFPGEHTCQVKSLLPSNSYSVKLTECPARTGICVDLFNLHLQTASDDPIHEMLDALAKEVDQATVAPADATSQLVIRVAYSKLNVLEIGNVKDVSVVVTPVNRSSPSEGPSWISPSSYLAESVKPPRMIGGTYVDPIDGSWEVRLAMPEAWPDSKLRDENVLLGSGLGIMTDSHDFNGHLAPETTFAIQLRVYTDFGFGTTAWTIRKTEGKQTGLKASGGLVAVSTIFAALCAVLIGLLTTLVTSLRSVELQLEKRPKNDLDDKQSEL